MDNPTIWMQTSLQRIYPASQPTRGITTRFETLQGEKTSIQIGIRNNEALPRMFNAEIQSPDFIHNRIRRVGHVALKRFNTDTELNQLEGVGHIPGFVPDPLFEENTLELGPFETGAFWLTFHVDKQAPEGIYDIVVNITRENEIASRHILTLQIHPILLEPCDLPVTHWIYPDAISDWCKIKPYEEALWSYLSRYIANLSNHGNTCLYCPIFTTPTDGVKKPHQLLSVHEISAGKYQFDFSNVLRWVELGRRHGALYFEWTHLFSQWGCANALRIYKDNANPNSLLWEPETSATSNTYRNFLAQFLPEFYNFLLHNNLLECSYFHVSDEPHGAEHLENYKSARQMLMELAPWMNVMDALSKIEYGKMRLTDIPIPSIGSDDQYTQEGIPHWVYYCCHPRGKWLNRLMDTPLTKIRMHGILFYKMKAMGFLHWGYNYWYKFQTQELINPFEDTDARNWPGWAFGDPFVVYPGEEGPLDSIRWEIFGESLQDYALLKMTGIDLEDPLLAEVRGYNDFPINLHWQDLLREKIINRLLNRRA